MPKIRNVEDDDQVSSNFEKKRKPDRGNKEPVPIKKDKLTRQRHKRNIPLEV